MPDVRWDQRRHEAPSLARRRQSPVGRRPPRPPPRCEKRRKKKRRRAQALSLVRAAVPRRGCDFESRTASRARPHSLDAAGPRSAVSAASSKFVQRRAARARGRRTGCWARLRGLRRDRARRCSRTPRLPSRSPKKRLENLAGAQSSLSFAGRVRRVCGFSFESVARNWATSQIR